MKKKIMQRITVLTLLVIAVGFSACQKASPVNARSLLTIDNLQADYREHISYVIDEASIEDGKATVNMTMPDLIMLFGESFNKNPDADDEAMLKELKNNLSKYSIEKAIEAPVKQVEGKWELQSYDSISAAIDASFSDFILHQLSLVDFSAFEMEVTS